MNENRNLRVTAIQLALEAHKNGWDVGESSLSDMAERIYQFLVKDEKPQLFVVTGIIDGDELTVHLKESH